MAPEYIHDTFKSPLDWPLALQVPERQGDGRYAR